MVMLMRKNSRPFVDVLGLDPLQQALQIHPMNISSSNVEVRHAIQQQINTALLIVPMFEYLELK